MSTPTGGTPAPVEQPQGKPHTGDLSEKVKKLNEESKAAAASRGGR
jgi:hypothetical protein